MYIQALECTQILPAEGKHTNRMDCKHSLHSIKVKFYSLINDLVRYTAPFTGILFPNLRNSFASFLLPEKGKNH